MCICVLCNLVLLLAPICVCVIAYTEIVHCSSPHTGHTLSPHPLFSLYDWRTKIRNECRIRLKQLAPVISTKTGQKSVLAAIRSAKAAKGKGELSVAAWDKLGQAALTRIVVEVLLFAVLSVVITTVLHLLEAAEQTLQVALLLRIACIFARHIISSPTLSGAQDRGTSLNVEIREKILKGLVEKQVLGIGLERLITDVSRAVCEATDGLDSGWCRGRSAHGEFMDLIRRCVCAFGKACEEVRVESGRVLRQCYWGACFSIFCGGEFVP